MTAAVKVKRPRFRPGMGQCSKCRCATTWDKLAFRDQRNPKRALICDSCREVFIRHQMYGHG